jgi:hypothetical protein
MVWFAWRDVRSTVTMTCTYANADDSSCEPCNDRARLASGKRKRPGLRAKGDSLAVGAYQGVRPGLDDAQNVRI